MMGGVFSMPDEPKMPKPDPPVAPAQPGVPARPRATGVGSTRARTIVAGDVTPEKVFKRKILG
jgi:hypothetical protein